MPPRVLVFGSTGQVARELKRAFAGEEIAATFLNRGQADLSRPETLGAIVTKAKPDLVIIAAAYTAVDRAESDEAAAMTINAVAPGAIGRAAAAISAPVIHFSTDYVFDGTKDAPYVETDAANPINAYGRSKLAGEEALREAHPHHLILRTSWVYSAHGGNFLDTALRLAESRDTVTIIADQKGCPTAAGDLARALAGTLPRLFAANVPWGTYHLAGATETTWHGFAEAIFSALAERSHRRPTNRAIETSAYPTPARRPMNGRLSSDRFAATFGVRLAGYAAALPNILDEALAAPAREAAL